jgi:hypothetical protein
MATLLIVGLKLRSLTRARMGKRVLNSSTGKITEKYIRLYSKSDW